MTFKPIKSEELAMLRLCNKWNDAIENLQTTLSKVNYRLEQLTPSSDYSTLGLVGVYLIEALQDYKKLLDLHEQRMSSEEIQKYNLSIRQYIEKHTK